MVTLYRIGEVHFRWLGTNGFHAQAKNERFRAAGSHCRRNLKTKMSRLLADKVRKFNQKACRTCSTIIFPRSTNQGIDLLLLPSSFLKLLIDMRADTPQPQRLAALPFDRPLTSSCCAPFVQGPNGSSV